MSKKCNHQNIDIKGVGCVHCSLADMSEMQKSAKEFLKLVKHEQFKQTKPLIPILKDVPRVGTRVAQVLHMKLVDGYTYKKIGEEMNFSATRARQLYFKGIYMIEEFLEKN